MAAPNLQTIRRVIYFSGRVQGVGFRYTTEAVASNFEVRGFVRNLGDGRVELVAEGGVREVERFQEAIEARMKGYIEKVAARDEAFTGEFDSFRISL